MNSRTRKIAAKLAVPLQAPNDQDLGEVMVTVSYLLKNAWPRDIRQRVSRGEFAGAKTDMGIDDELEEKIKGLAWVNDGDFDGTGMDHGNRDLIFFFQSKESAVGFKAHLLKLRSMKGRGIEVFGV